ncbi:MAG: hypothetical protein IE937_05715, partial [Gammaproteobacteria bacterium]|nr:hypothetical protein [Gammaproteobacteria bacterium]
MTNKPIAYLDADILLHRAVSFVESDFDGDPMNDWRQAMFYFDFLKEKWLKEVGDTEDYFLVISVGRNFRYDLYDDYKGNRKDIEPHPSFSTLKQEVMELQGVVWEEGIEADDYIGIKVTENPGTSIAVSADKDFATIPCKLYVPSSHGRTKGSWYSFTEDEANMNWLRQTLTGDTIDNYKGIPGIGPKKAEKI